MSDSNDKKLEELDKKLSYFIGEFKEYQKQHNSIHETLAAEVMETMKFIAPVRSLPVILGTLIALGTLASMFIGGIWWVFNHLK